MTKRAQTKVKATTAEKKPTTTPRQNTQPRPRPKTDPIERLVVIDRLEVGPVELRRDRLRAPYRVVNGEDVHETHLVYRYQEKVFEKNDPGSIHLASVIAAQVALNYGLFCREIVLHGPFDPHDRRFLEEMLENTSREIYVKKFLEPNPFLTDAVRDLPAEPRERFTRAKLVFPDAVDKAEPMPWDTNPEHYAVLSSGGKDSLLSFGLLHELGIQAHPIFGNESGRHWHTALNAYRHFQEYVPYSTRVWMNSDRVFSWMLRHLPFIRPDFHSLRTDEYPIRLWTVAVFSFGALPLIRKRGLGSLLIGDEYDTTVPARHQGIPHYDGLFDQSIYFDHALTRYMRAKGWSVDQFSLLRNLSEFLIEKTLSERYPELLQLQMSCHATHLDGTRARPCGRCEKCRRIIGMLLAVGQRPTQCGYSEEQVGAAKLDLVDKGIHQEKEAIADLALQLHERGVIAEPRLGGVRGRRHPEVQQLRFHPKRAPIDELPLSIRPAILGALLHHATGAVERKDGAWIPLDPRTDPRFRAAGHHDATRGSEPGKLVAKAPPGPSSHIWGELTWPDAKKRLA
jgi:hypothetical protein